MAGDGYESANTDTHKGALGQSGYNTPTIRKATRTTKSRPAQANRNHRCGSIQRGSTQSTPAVRTAATRITQNSVPLIAPPNRYLASY